MPNKLRSVFFIKDNLLSDVDFVVADPENIFSTNIVDQKIHTRRVNEIIIADMLLFVKNPPGYVSIIIVITTKNNTNKIVPYFDKGETFSNKLFVSFEYLNMSYVSGSVINVTR